MKNIINSPKDDDFRTRVNSEIKNELESIFVNTSGYPFSVNEDNVEKMKTKGLNQLMKELDKGISCKESYSEKDTLKMLGLANENSL